RAGGEGDVEAIVDEEERAEASRQRLEAQGPLVELAGRRMLVAELYGGRPRLEGREHHVVHGPRRGDPLVGYDDQPEVEGKGAHAFLTPASAARRRSALGLRCDGPGGSPPLLGCARRGSA